MSDETPAAPSSLAIPLSTLLYDEGDLVAVDKPAGLPVVPARGPNADDCLRARLEQALGCRLWVVHRIDKPVTGVVLFARTPEAHRDMSLRFAAGEVRRRYLAWVLGVPDPAQGRIDIPIREGRKGRMKGAPDGKVSRTDYRVLDSMSWPISTPAAPDQPGQPGEATTQAALVEARLVTGRRHQIRLHLAYRGHPVLFDLLYAGPQSDALARLRVHLGAAPGAPAIHLHARSLSWSPRPGSAPIEILAPTPPAFRPGDPQPWHLEHRA